MVPVGEDSARRPPGCRRSNAGGAGGEEGCEGTELPFPVLLGGAWSSVPFSLTRDSRDGPGPAQHHSKQTRSCTTHCSSVTHGAASLPRAQRSPGAPHRSPGSCSAAPSPQTLRLPPPPRPFPSLSPSSRGPEGSIPDSGFSQIFSQHLPRVDAVTPAKMLPWLGAPARTIRPVLPARPRPLAPLLRAWRPADEQDGAPSPPTPSPPSLQALFLHLVSFFHAQFLHFFSTRFPSHPPGAGGGYRRGSASPWGWRAPARRGGGGTTQPGQRLLHKLL